MTIKKGQIQDLSSILDIISTCIADMQSVGNDQWDQYYPTADIIENDIQRGVCYILKNNGQCAAYVAIDEDQSFEYSQINWSTDGRKVLVIHRLSVHPAFQRKGIAKKLLGFIETFAAENNYSDIRLDAYSGNEKALKLYENFDYRKTGQFNLSNRNLPFYCYEKNRLNFNLLK